MTSVLTSVATIETLADLLEQLGGIAPERVRFRPPPGTATEKDVLAVEAHEDRLCELVDSVLVEKAMGWRELLLALCACPTLPSFPGTAYPTGVYPATQSQLWHPILPWNC